MIWVKRWKWAVLAAAAVIIGGGIALAIMLDSRDSLPNEVAQGQNTYTVVRGDIQTSLTVYGEVVPAQEYNFTFDGDDVEEIYVKVGNRVEEGDILVELDRTQAELSLLQAERSLREAEVAGVPNTIREKELSYQLALEKYDATTLTAPFAGVITRLAQATSSSENWSLRLINTSELYIEASVDQLDAPGVAIGQIARAIIEPLPDTVWTVELVEVGGMATSSGSSMSVSVMARLPEADSSILVGYTADMEIITASAMNALIVPITCLTESPRGWMVTKIVGDERVPTQVSVGALSDQYVEVIDGVEEGDVILVNSLVTPVSKPEDAGEEESRVMRQRTQGGTAPSGGFPGGTP